MKLNYLVNFLENWAPLTLQEEYDNCGLLVGNDEMKVSAVLVSLEVTEEVILEAIDRKANVIVSHHPVIFKAVNSLTGKTEAERCVIMAIENSIALYAIHTNLDSIYGGVSFAMGTAMGLSNMKILAPRDSNLYQLVVHVPAEHTDALSKALFQAGAGSLGNYDQCKFSTNGKGSYRPLNGSNPYLGNIGKIQLVNEERLELLVPSWSKGAVEKALFLNHPYEEVSHAWFKLTNKSSNTGFGVVGELPSALKDEELIEKMKFVYGAKTIRYSPSKDNYIKRVALCGGAGIDLLSLAIKSEADAFITSDISYHKFFDAKKVIFLADIGHYESERHTIELIADHIRSKMTNFAVLTTESITNPIITS